MMQNIGELTTYVSEKARQYMEETGEVMEKFPSSIVDFVIEYVVNGCHFPTRYKEEQVVEMLEKGKNSLAIACVDIYAKIGAEGQKSHSENGTSRSYDSAWITFDLLAHFPNFVEVIT